MNRRLIYASITMIILILVNWSSQDSTVSGNRKHRINFYGKLETYEGNIYNVENISIGMKYKQICFFEAPKKLPHDFILTKDPRKGFISKIDLAEISKLSVPRPYLKFTFKKGTIKREYIEVIITFKDKEKTERTYLIDPRIKIECDEKTNAGPIEMESLSFTALKKLTVEGYSYREPQNEPENKKIKKSIN